MATHSLRILFTFFLVSVISCSSSSSSSGDGEDDLNLDDRTYSCLQAVTTGDTCGDQFITGTETTFTFSQSATLTGVDIGGQITLSGTFDDNALSLSNSRTEYIGPGCHVVFTNVSLTATILTTEEIEGTWTGTLSYSAEVDTDDADCASYEETDCMAVHTVSCTAD